MRVIAPWLVLLVASSAAATIGEPQQVTAAWLDPETREVLVRIEGTEFPTIRGLPLGGERPRRFQTLGVVADWSDWSLDDRRDRLEALPATDPSLVQVERSSARAIGRRSDETLRGYDVRVRLRGPRGSREVRVTTFGSPDVRVARVLNVPGEPYALVVLEYVGLDYEGGYSVEEPVLLRWSR